LDKTNRLHKDIGRDFALTNKIGQVYSNGKIDVLFYIFIVEHSHP